MLVGINLLREGLDLPEVALVAILDADKEGFLRSTTLADPDLRPRRAQRRGPRDPLRGEAHRLRSRGRSPTVERRRAKQAEYNAEHGIVPRTIVKPVRDSIEALYDMDYTGPDLPDDEEGEDEARDAGSGHAARELARLRDDMLRAATELRFEEAARLRDRIRKLEKLELAR